MQFSCPQIFICGFYFLILQYISFSCICILYCSLRCPPGYEKQWLARIASNKAKDYLRSAWVRRVNTPGDDILALEGAPPGSDPEQQVLDAMSEETLTGKILGMREPYRTPCRLMLLEGRTAAEAAALCGRPQKTVEAQIYRAKKMLAEQIRQERRSEDGIVS